MGRAAQTREDQVVMLAASGMTDIQIAQHLGLSPHTVATYWRRLRESTGYRNRSQIVAESLRTSRSGGQALADARDGTEALTQSVLILVLSLTSDYLRSRPTVEKERGVEVIEKMQGLLTALGACDRAPSTPSGRGWKPLDNTLATLIELVVTCNGPVDRECG